MYWEADVHLALQPAIYRAIFFAPLHLSKLYKNKILALN